MNEPFSSPLVASMALHLESVFHGALREQLDKPANRLPRYVDDAPVTLPRRSYDVTFDGEVREGEPLGRCDDLAEEAAARAVLLPQRLALAQGASPKRCVMYGRWEPVVSFREAYGRLHFTATFQDVGVVPESEWPGEGSK